MTVQINFSHFFIGQMEVSRFPLIERNLDFGRSDIASRFIACGGGDGRNDLRLRNRNVDGVALFSGFTLIIRVCQTRHDGGFAESDKTLRKNLVENCCNRVSHRVIPR